MRKAESYTAREHSKIWVENLVLLDFPVQETERTHLFTLNEQLFDKPNKKAFEVLSHFLFCKWEPGKCEELFRHCYPILDKARSQQFRTVCLNLWRRISEENPNFNIPRMTSTTLMSPCGPEIHKFLALFSGFVLFTECRRADVKGEENTLLPPIALVKSKSLGHDQVMALKSACHHDCLDCLHNMQVARHTDKKAKKLVDKLVQEYRDLTRRNKELTERIKLLSGSAKVRKVHDTSSRGIRTAESPYKQPKMNPQLKHDIAKVNQMWDKLLNAVSETQATCEVVESILSGDVEQNTLSASTLSPKVPATLLRQCTAEAYDRVGGSLYEAGRLNLVSLMSLFNLSLHLLIEKLHEVKVPNFESQIPYINVQVQVHSRNVKTLREMCKDVERTLPESRETVKHLKRLVDEKYKKQQQEKAASGTSKHQSSSTKSTPKDGEKLGVLPSTPPFRFPQNGTIETPPKHYQLPLNDIPTLIFSNFGSPARKADARDESVDFESAEVPATSSILSTGDEDSKPSLRQGSLDPHGLVAKRAVRQKKKAVSKPASKIGKAHLSVGLPRAMNQNGGGKSLSLPSTPVRGDAQIERVTSRTPEAMKKLINQIVDSTMEEMDPAPWYVPSTSSPPVTAAAPFDLAAQLDMDVFAPGDKISRTPPLVPQQPSNSFHPASTKENVDPNTGLSDDIGSQLSSRTSNSGSGESSKTRSPNTGLIDDIGSPLSSRTSNSGSGESSKTRTSDDKTILPNVTLILPQNESISKVMPHVVDECVPDTSTNNFNATSPKDIATDILGLNSTHEFSVPSAPAPRPQDTSQQQGFLSPSFMGRSATEIMQMDLDSSIYSHYPSLMDMSLPPTPDIPLTPAKPEREEAAAVPVGNLIDL